ncbi:MAG: class I SAM-dependent methyltransferase [Verrucomicrobia bacterium]|nr:class I SAM-dependent methyltransferase [Verrucomicrobiota bacterium]
MSQSIKDPSELQSIYEHRFSSMLEYRTAVWRILTTSFFQQFVRPADSVLDLGCGYGEFINHIACRERHGMDLNPKSPAYLAPGVKFIAQDCSTPWQLPDASLDVVFTSNFFEHLPDKKALRDTLVEAHRCLRPGGRLIALGPNIKYVQGAYWDFWDHFLCLTEMSLGEALENNGYRVVRSHARFLPYSMVNVPRYPVVLLRAYLALPFLWPVFGKQFLVVAEKV